MADKIKIKRGIRGNLPTLDIGEFGFTTDTKELFIGAPGGNEQIAKKTDVIGSSGPNESYVIELSRWGITQGSFGKPPYTTGEWEIAYNNLLGFNSALVYARDNGYNKIVVPRGIYSFCYTNLNGGPRPVDMVGTPIKLQSNQTLDLNGSTFEVMYDSLNKNPYDKSPETTPAWKLSGTLISMDECFNSHLTNGKIIGDIPNRSFSDGGSGFESEKGMEQTKGIGINNGAKYCSISHIDISMFMGDAIRIGNSPTSTANWNVSGWGNNVCSPGYIGNDGIITAMNGAYVSPKYTIIQGEHKIIQMRTNGGYTRIVPVKGKVFEFVFLDASEVVIARKKAVYLQTVSVPHNASYLRMQFTNEDVGLASLTLDYAITKPQASNIHIHRCEIHDNHRGGISGGADFTLIEYNKIYHNGLDSGIGTPIFPDTTRYCINFEDSYCNELIIRDNHMFSGFNGLLLGAYHITVSGNIMTDFSSGVLIYNNAKALIEDNVFYNAGSLGLMDNTTAQDRVIIFNNNHVFGGGMVVQPTHRTRVHVTNNKLSPDSFTIVGDVQISDNRFISPTENRDTSNNCSIRSTKCVDNTFEQLKVSVNKYDVNSMMGQNSYKSCAITTHSSVNDAEYVDSIFVDSSISQLQILDKSKPSSMSFINCNFQDCTFLLANMYQNDITNGVNVSAIFKNCKIKMTASSSVANLIGIADNVAKSSYSAGITPRKYEAIFSNCEFDNSASTITNYILNNDNNDRDRKLVIEKSSVDINKLKLFRDIATNVAILKNNSYLNSSTLPIMTLAKIESYNEILTPSGSVYPSSLTPMIGACWFNTATGRPYWWNGTTWVDATGISI